MDDGLIEVLQPRSDQRGHSVQRRISSSVEHGDPSQGLRQRWPVVNNNALRAKALPTVRLQLRPNVCSRQTSLVQLLQANDSRLCLGNLGNNALSFAAPMMCCSLHL